MLDSARDVQLERLKLAQRMYELSKPKDQKPAGHEAERPQRCRPHSTGSCGRGRYGTYVHEEKGGAPPEVWAAVPLANGDVMSLHTLTRTAVRRS